MRKNIFQIIKEHDNVARKSQRVSYSFEIEQNVTIFKQKEELRFSMSEVVDEHLFSTWKQRAYCTSLEDFLETLGFEQLTLEDDVESLVTVIEVVYNFWMLIYVRLYEEDGVTCEDAVPEHFLRVKKTMDEYLSQCNHKIVYDSEQESVLVIEDNPTVTAVVEVVDAPVALDILKYNHHALKGDLKSKKEILRNMGDALENREKELLRVDANLKKTIFHVLNTMGIRHMNTQNTANVAKVGESLEYWYDELYQMMLLAFLRMDNVERMQKYEAELKPLLT